MRDLKNEIREKIKAPLFVALYDNYAEFDDIEVHIGKFTFKIDLSYLCVDILDVMEIRHDNLNITKARRKQILNSKLMKEMTNEIKAEIKEIEDIHYLTPCEDDNDAIIDAYNTIVSERLG